MCVELCCSNTVACDLHMPKIWGDIQICCAPLRMHEIQTVTMFSY